MRDERGVIRSGAYELGYTIEGTGPVALVVGSALYYPRTFSRELRQSLTLVCADHRGFGRVVGETGAADVELDAVVDDIELVRQRLGLGDVIIVGHSGHAYLALEYAKRYPEHATHVVMIGVGPNQGSQHKWLTETAWEETVAPERKARFEEDLRRIAAEVEQAPDRRFITYAIRMAARSWYDPAFDPAPLWDGVHVNMPVFDHLWGQVFRDIDITRGLDELVAPVWLGLGRADYLVAPYWSWQPYRASFPDLTVRVFERSGHTPQLEESARFDAELLAWLAEKGSDAGQIEEERIRSATALVSDSGSASSVWASSSTTRS
jgi:proline iminopeptidase